MSVKFKPRPRSSRRSSRASCGRAWTSARSTASPFNSRRDRRRKEARMPQDHRNRKDDTRDGKLVQFDALVAMLKRRPPMRSIEDDQIGLVSQTAPLAGLWALARSAGWVLPHAGICWVSERHDWLRWDAAGRLHCTDGPAVHYPDGWGVHLWHGTRVPAAWIEERAALSATVALTWPQVEQRRAACEILGWEAVLREVHAVTVQADPDPSIGTLLRADLPDAPGSQFLRVRCATGRDFVLPVPADVRTAQEANGWTWGLRPHYSPAVQ